MRHIFLFFAPGSHGSEELVGPLNPYAAIPSTLNSEKLICSLTSHSKSVSVTVTLTEKTCLKPTRCSSQKFALCPWYGRAVDSNCGSSDCWYGSSQNWKHVNHGPLRRVMSVQRAPSIGIVPTLGPKVHKYDLLWAIGSPREWQIW